MIDSHAKQLLTYIQGKTDSLDPNLALFMNRLQKTHFINRAEQIQNHMMWVERITQMALGELNAMDLAKTQSILHKYPQYQELYDTLTKILTHFKEVDKSKSLQKLRDLGKKLVEQTQPSPPLTLALRGSEEDINAPIRLPIAPMYGFEVVFFLGSYEQNTRYVSGRVRAREKTSNFNGAKVWLLSEEQRKWYEALVEDNGRFRFPQVPSGSYTFEMAWAKDAFLEVLDVMIPKG